MRRGVAIALVLLASAAIASYLICRPQTKRVGKTISNIKWGECEGTGANYVDVQSVEVNGDFNVGTYVSVYINGIVKTPFQMASLEGSVKYGFLTLYTEDVRRDPPTDYNEGPVREGKSILIEQNFPNGAYTVISRLKGPGGKVLQCVQASYKLSS